MGNPRGTGGKKMKAKTLAALMIVVGWLALAPGAVKAQENQWYQGQQGKWVCSGWRWESSHGDQWYQGRQGHWYQERNGWQFRSNDGDTYRQGANGWDWHQRHDAENN
jgi:hypothetical protein